MNSAPLKVQPDHLPDVPGGPLVGLVPYVTIHAFCVSSDLIGSMTRAAADRRLSRADVTVSPGGIGAAIRCFASQPTPDLLVIESQAEDDVLLSDLEALAGVCDPRTKVIVVGASNDIALYRQLMDSGVTEYLVGPVEPLSLIGAVMRLFQQEGAARLGRIFAFMGVKGGTGSSTIAQNVAWSLAQRDRKVLLVDMDLQFGTAALNLDIDSPAGFAEQLGDADRLDEGLLERLLFKRGPNLSVLAGATSSHHAAEPALEVVDRMLDLARATFPFVVLDLPHAWSPWVRRSLLAADEVVLTAAPELASLRNAQCLMDLLREARPNDAKPALVLNQVGMPRRAEIPPEKFASALKVDLAASIGFDPVLFSAAANSGQMIAEASPKAAAGRAVEQIAQGLSGSGPRARPAPKGFARLWRS